MKLTECHIIVVKGCQKEDVFARKEIVGQKASNFNVIGPIWELFPFCGVIRESIGVFL